MMGVVQVTPDAGMMVAGYEHRVLQCPECGELERRLLFNRADPPAAEPDHPPPALAGPGRESRTQAPDRPSEGAWVRAIRKLRAQQSELEERAALAQAARQMEAFHMSWNAGFRAQAAPAASSSPRRPAELPYRMKSSKFARELEARRAGGKWARLVAKLGDQRVAVRRAGITRMAGTTSAPRTAIDDFDRLWEGTVEIEAPGPEMMSQRVPSTSLAPVVDASAGLWARAIVMLSGREPLRHAISQALSESPSPAGLSTGLSERGSKPYERFVVDALLPRDEWP
jgi:hypothetical protein